MTNDDIQRFIDDILEALSDNAENEVSREELEKELKKFLEYGVPIDHAKQTLVKKFGGSLASGPTGRTLVVDLVPNQNSVNLLCRVITVNPREVTVKGDTRMIFYGILGDESGTVPFTAWKDFQIEKGDVVQISNAYTKEWQGDTKVNLGDRTRIEKTEESELPESNLEPKEYKIKDLKSGLGAVEVTARILEVNKRDVEVNGQKKNVFSGTIGDETGKAQYTSWHDFGLKEGDVVKISGGYVKSWKGIPQLTFDERATLDKIESNKISKKDITTRKLLLHELVERRGAIDVEVEGTVVRIRPGSGLVERCPECNRVVQNNECTIHGKVKGIADLRIKLDIDDCMGTVSGIIGKEITEKLIGKTHEELKKIVDTKDENAVVEEINKALFAHRISLQGNALGDEFGVTIIAKDGKRADIDVQTESEKISREMEELQ